MTYPRTWWGDFNVSLHWPRAACFYFWGVLGAFLAPQIHYDRLALALFAIFWYLQIGAYSVDLLRGNHIGQTHFSRQHLNARTALGLGVALAIGVYLTWTVSWMVDPLMIIGVIGILGYNYEVLGMHSRIAFGLVWGLYPVVSYNVLMTLAFPPPVVWIVGFSAVAFAELHITSYGLWGCRLPEQYCCVSEGKTECHGMDPHFRRWLGKTSVEQYDTGINGVSITVKGKVYSLRQATNYIMSNPVGLDAKRAIHRLAKRQSNLQVAFLGLVTLAVVVWRLWP